MIECCILNPGNRGAAVVLILPFNLSDRALDVIFFSFTCFFSVFFFNNLIVLEDRHGIMEIVAQNNLPRSFRADISLNLTFRT